MLLSRTKWPPQGWQYHQAATGWRAPAGLTFDQVVDAIIAHRKQNAQYNLNTDRKTVAQELDDFTCARLKHNPSWCHQNVPASFTSPLPRLRHQAGGQNVVGASRSLLKNTKAGIKTWLDWFGDGRPVEPAIAEKRASICVTCPQMQKADIKTWFQRIAAQEIFAIFNALNDLDLKTQHDEKLHVCKACDCPMKAKVWVPLSFIKKHMEPTAVAKLDARCWIHHET